MACDEKLLERVHEVGGMKRSNVARPDFTQLLNPANPGNPDGEMHSEKVNGYTN